jgi:heme exporter protein B
VFSAINISSKLYQNDAKGRKYYLGFIASPLEIYFSKLLFNCFFIFLTSTIGYFIYSIVLGNVVNQFGIFFLVIVMGSLGFASLLTTVAAIASKGNGNFSLMAVLSFPMLIPYLITLIKFSKNVIDEINFTFNYKLLVIMFAIITLQIALSFLLIPYLWRD